jgi:hypothetical protein
MMVRGLHIYQVSRRGVTVTAATDPHGDAFDLGGPFLIVCNQPEDMGGLTAGQLHKCEIPLVANVTQRFRLFVWHIAKADPCARLQAH